MGRARSNLRIDDALERVCKVSGRQLARLAAEARMRREEDPGPDVDGKRAVVGGHLGEHRGRPGNDRGGSRNRVEHEKGIVDATHQHHRLHVVHARWVERLGHRGHAHTQLPHRRIGGCGRRRSVRRQHHGQRHYMAEASDCRA
jgi:hypothetical protein